MRTAISRLLIVLALAPAVALAQGVPINVLPNASTPLSGSELMALQQNGQAVKATVSTVAGSSLIIANNTVLGNVSGATAAASALTASQLTTLLGLGTAAFQATGTSGHTIPFLDGANTWSALQTLTAGISITGPVSLGNTTVNGTLGVTGVSSLGTGSANYVTVTGSGSAPTIGTNSGNVTIAPAAGTTSVTGTAAVSGAATVGSTLAVTGSSTLGGTVAATGGVLQVGVASTTIGRIEIFGNTSGTVTIRPQATAGTFNFNLPITAGTSGQPLISGGGGATAMGWGNLSGNTTTFGTTSGVLTSGDCARFDASGNIVDAGAACGTGTVNAGTAGQMAYYASSTNAVSGNANATISAGALTLGVSTSALGSLILSGNTSGAVTITPQAAAGTFNFNLPITAGTSGGPMLSGGGGASPMTWGTRSGNTTVFGTTSGALTSGMCVQADASGNLVDAGTACGGVSLAAVQAAANSF